MKGLVKFLWPFKYKSHKVICYHKLSVYFKKIHLNYLSEYCQNKIYKKFNCIIHTDAQIGENVEFPHPIGIVIGAGACIGDNVIIYQNVTIGRKDRNIFKCPKIEKNSIIYANSVILGNIIIGESTIIGANSVVTKDTEPNSVYVGAPARRIK